MHPLDSASARCGAPKWLQMTNGIFWTTSDGNVICIALWYFSVDNNRPIVPARESGNDGATMGCETMTSSVITVWVIEMPPLLPSSASTCCPSNYFEPILWCSGTWICFIYNAAPAFHPPAAQACSIMQTDPTQDAGLPPVEQTEKLRGLHHSVFYSTSL